MTLIRTVPGGVTYTGAMNSSGKENRVTDANAQSLCDAANRKSKSKGYDVRYEVAA